MRPCVNALLYGIIAPMALFLSLFLSLFIVPPTDTPGGPIVQSAPVVQTAAVLRNGSLPA